MRMWKQWIEDGHTQRLAGTGPRNVTTAWDDCHLVRMTMTDCAASSTVLSRRWSPETGVDLSESNVRRRLLRAGLVAVTSASIVHEPPTASDCNKHVNAITGVLNGKM